MGFGRMPVACVSLRTSRVEMEWELSLLMHANPVRQFLYQEDCRRWKKEAYL